MINVCVDRRIYINRGVYLWRGRLFNRNGYVLIINIDGMVYGIMNKDLLFGEILCFVIFW